MPNAECQMLNAIPTSTVQSPVSNSNDDLVAQIRRGEPLAIARAITRVELSRALFAFTGHAHIVGITGAPGTGKSTLVNALAKEYRARGKRVAIIAVDPTSPFSGGALLG